MNIFISSLHFDDSLAGYKIQDSKYFLQHSEVFITISSCTNDVDKFYVYLIFLHCKLSAFSL